MIALLIAALPSPNVMADRVDIIELNSVYDENGAIVYRQWIFWRRGNVVAWRMPPGDNVRQLPTDAERAAFAKWWTARSRTKRRPNPQVPPWVPPYKGKRPTRRKNGDLVLIWIDRTNPFDKGYLRRVVCRRYVESWTLYDVEAWERTKLPKEERVGLSRFPDLDAIER